MTRPDQCPTCKARPLAAGKALCAPCEEFYSLPFQPAPQVRIVTTMPSFVGTTRLLEDDT